MEQWKTLSRREILNHSKYLKVESHHIELPDGTQIPDWPWLVTPDFVNVVVVDTDGMFVCFRQVKYAIEGTAIAPVGGYLEPGEAPLAAAKRETLEETGYTSERWSKLGTFRVDSNRGSGVAHFFLAEDASKTAERDADDLEEQHLLLFTRDDLEAVLDDGVKILPWVSVFALALRKLS